MQNLANFGALPLMLVGDAPHRDHMLRIRDLRASLKAGAAPRVDNTTRRAQVDVRCELSPRQRAEHSACASTRRKRL